MKPPPTQLRRLLNSELKFSLKSRILLNNPILYKSTYMYRKTLESACKAEKDSGLYFPLEQVLSYVSSQVVTRPQTEVYKYKDHKAVLFVRLEPINYIRPD